MSRIVQFIVFLLWSLLGGVAVVEGNERNHVVEQEAVKTKRNNPLRDFGMCFIYEEFMGLSMTRRRDNCTCVDREITCSSSYPCGSDDDNSEAVACSDWIHFNLFRQPAGRGSAAPDEFFNITACSDTSARDGFDEVCVDITSRGMILQPTIDECVSATYGGKPCFCEVCDGGNGLDIDCSQYDMYATSNGCRSASIGDVEAILPNLGFGDSPVLEENPVERQGTSSSSIGGNSRCSVVFLLFATVAVVSLTIITP